MYELSTSFVAHKSDIVGLTVNADDSIISCSKDKTIKIWRYNEGTRQFFEADTIYSKSNLTCKFPTCVCILLPSDIFECGLIVTGDNDNRIFVYEPNNAIPIRHTRAHSNAVSKLARSPEPNVFLSASWDTTVRMWLITEDNLKCLLTIESHSASVWAVLQMNRKFIVTGSADKLIHIFDVDGKLLNTLKGHKDCVRDLAEINDEQILSCSNDCTVRRWSVDSGFCLQILTGHPNYVYSVRTFGDLIVSSGEEKCLLLWSHGKPWQTITLPSRSNWNVAVLSNNDIVVGSSDGIMRIFTASKNRRADEETLLSFTEECSTKDPIKLTIGRKKFSRLPGANVLSNPGVREGQKEFVRLHRESKEVYCFSWSVAEKKWINDGIVDINFSPLISSHFKSKDENSILEENKQLNFEKSANEYSCVICRKKFIKKSSIRKHVIEKEHTIARTPKYLLPILPTTHPYQVISFEKNGSDFRLKLCLENMNSHDELQVWVKSFADLSSCVYLKCDKKQYGRERSSYSEFYQCQLCYTSDSNHRLVRGKSNCKSTISGIVNRDSDNHSYYGKININFSHNHRIYDAGKFKKPTPEVTEMFRQMCLDGLTPSKAMHTYRERLKMQSPVTFVNLLQDRSVFPDYDWVRQFFRKTRAQKKIDDETPEPRRSSRIRDQGAEIEDCDDDYELEQCEVMETEEIVSDDGIERVSENDANIIPDVVQEFGQFLSKLEEDPPYYREGTRSMSGELKKLCESTAESRLMALHSFNKSSDNMERSE